MSTYLKSTVVVFVVILGLAVSAGAELSPDLAQWAESPAGYLLTDDERKAWEKIDDDAEAKHFIELFWARRNPNPTETFNEFKATFQGHVRYADENFSHEGSRGALTDRGRVMILLGIPHSAERRAPTETVQSVGSAVGQTGMGSDEVRSSVEMWTYDPARLPEAFGIKGTHILFVFYEDKNGSNNFTMDRSHREASKALRTMSRAPEVYLLHPELTEVPKPISVPNGQPASAEHLGWLDGPALPFDDQAQVIAESGVADATHQPLWLHLALPAAAPDLDLLAGRVSNEAGDVVSTFSIAANALTTAAGKAYHLTFPVAPGTFRVEVAGSAAGVPQVKIDETVTLDGIPLEGAWVSPIWLGLNAEREDNAPLGSAFTFGGWHLRPLGEGPVAKNNQLSYFGFVVRPGAGDDGNPALRARIVLKQNGQRLGQPLLKPIGAAPVTTDVYLFADALNLAAFPPGEFEFEFTVEDTVTKTKVKRSVTLNLTE